MSFFNEFGHEVYDIADIVRGFEPYCGIVHLELAHKLVYACNHRLRVFERGDTRLVGFCDNLVVNVRVVAGIVDFVADFLEILADDIVNQRLIGVTDMGVTRHRDTARIHIDLSVVKRNEVFFFSCESVVNFHSFLLRIFIAVCPHLRVAFVNTLSRTLPLPRDKDCPRQQLWNICTSVRREPFLDRIFSYLGV